MSNEPAVVLLDLENVIGVKPPPELLASRLAAIQKLAGPVAVWWAAYPTTLLSEDSRKVLKAHGVKTRWAKAGKNGADKALLNLAHKEAANGYRRFVVVSADADFVSVAALGTLEVIVRQEQEISKRLRDRAVRVHRLPRPAISVAPNARKIRSVADSDGIAGSRGRPQDAPQEVPRPTRCRPSAGQLAAASLGLWVAGVCVGAGFTAGSILTRRLLRA